MALKGGVEGEGEVGACKESPLLVGFANRSVANGYVDNQALLAGVVCGVVRSARQSARMLPLLRFRLGSVGDDCAVVGAWGSGYHGLLLAWFVFGSGCGLVRPALQSTQIWSLRRLPPGP